MRERHSKAQADGNVIRYFVINQSIGQMINTDLMMTINEVIVIHPEGDMNACTKFSQQSNQ